jgi:23S rRNA (guanosine2251-2'-O)-methyltransferase
MAKRRRSNSEFIYGLNPVAEALEGQRSHSRLLVRGDRREDRRVANLIMVAQRMKIPVEPGDQQQLDRFADSGNHQGVVLETGPFRYIELDQLLGRADGRTILVLDHLQDPQNLATLIRTAAAVDVAGIVIQSDRSAQVTPAVVRSSAGLVEKVPIARENNTRRAIDYLKEHGYWAVAVESHERSENIYSANIPFPVALVVGSEAKGIASNVLNACDIVVQLPMPGRTESLNAAVAGSVALYEILRRATDDQLA